MQGTGSAGHRECRALRVQGTQSAGHRGVQGTRACRAQGSAGHRGVQGTGECRAQGVQGTGECRAQGVQGTGSAGHRKCRACNPYVAMCQQDSIETFIETEILQSCPHASLVQSSGQCVPWHIMII